MQRLLQRVRTSSDAEPAARTSPKTGAKEAITSGKGKSRVAASLGLDVEKGSTQPESTAPLTQESFVPRQQAPELRNDLTALRELANSNARRAISRSDTRRSSSEFYIKLAVSALSASSAVVLLMLNGLKINMPFAGMVSAVIVSFLWGFDCLNHLRRLKGEEKNTPASNSHNPAMNSIQVGQQDSMGEHWRPTPV
jgi:multidrug resistance efflux pump